MANQRTLIKLEPSKFIEAILCNLVKDAYEALAPHTSCADLLRDQATIRRRIACEGLAFATVELPALGNSFLEFVETGTSTFPGFRTRNQIPVFLRGLFVCYKSGFRKETAFGAIYQITSAFKKLKGAYNEDVLIKQYQAFIDTDRELSDVNTIVENDNDQTLKLARYFCKEVFAGFDLSHKSFVPRPGPGATNSPCPKHMRYEPHIVYPQHDDVMPYAEWFYPLMTDVNHAARNYVKAMNASAVPTARFKFVPKTAHKARGICIEENESQFLQQAVANGIRWKIDHSYLRSYIQLENQSLNGQLAIDSSASRSYATIDMSEASDRIARSLALYIFQFTELRDALSALSTTVIEPDVNDAVDSLGPLQTNKFAPMGSGLCFPVMTLVHYFLIKAIICRKYNVTPSKAEEIYVYGDDIIVPTKYAQAVFDELPKYGMKLNRNKSFMHSSFRESCGKHAYNGHEVTPVYIKYAKLDQPTSLHSLAVNERSLRLNGWITAADTILSYLRRSGMREVPPDSGLFGIIREARDGVPPLFDFKRRWNDDYQTWQYRVPLLKAQRTTNVICDGTSALMRYWGLHTEVSHRVDDRPFDSDITVKWMWYPTSP
jgi:hypothetical protein